MICITFIAAKSSVLNDLHNLLAILFNDLHHSSIAIQGQFPVVHRLLHSLSLVALSLSLVYETWSQSAGPNIYIEGCLQLHCIMWVSCIALWASVNGGNPHWFSEATDRLLHNMPSRRCKENVKESSCHRFMDSPDVAYLNSADFTEKLWEDKLASNTSTSFPVCYIVSGQSFIHGIIQGITF